MKPDDLEFFLEHSESRESPPHRLLLAFEGSEYAVILLNHDGLPLTEHYQDLEGKAFESASTPEILELPLPGLGFEEGPPHKQKAWRLQYDGSKLILPMKKSPYKISKSLILGDVITGKANIANKLVKEARVLLKSEPTPFILDQWGDSYNDSYYLEPRIVDTVPSTVFNAVKCIMNFGRSAFETTDYEASATKYRKAFHYCHSYYPDDLEPSDLETATRLKLQSLLNLALAGIKCNTRERLSQAVESCDFVLGMPEATDKDKAKALYRRGQANLLRGDDEVALRDFEQSQVLIHDPATELAIEKCALARRQRHSRLKASLKGAFG